MICLHSGLEIVGCKTYLFTFFLWLKEYSVIVRKIEDNNEKKVISEISVHYNVFIHRLRKIMCIGIAHAP